MAQEQQLSSPGVQQAPMPGVKVEDNAPIGAFGGGEATAGAFGAATDLANTSADILYKQAARKKELADLQANYGFATQLSELQTNLLYDPKTGAVNQHGTNADGVTGKVMDAWQKGVSDIATQAQTPQQMEAFQRLAASHHVELYRAVAEHEDKEHTATTVNTISATAAQYADAAEKSALTDPAATQMNLRRADAAYQQLAGLNGLTPDSRQAFLNAQNSKNHMRVLSALVDAQQDLKAEQYFKDHKDAFFGNDYTEALKKTQQASVLGESYRRMDLILLPKTQAMQVGEEGPPQQADKSRQEAMAEAAKIDNPRIRKMTTELLESYFSEQMRAQQQDVAQAFMDSSRLMNQPQNKTALQNGQPLEAVLPPSLLDRVAASPEHLNALRGMSVDRQVSEPDSVLQMSRLISDKAALGKMDIADVMAKVGGRLNTSDRAGLQKAWYEAHEAYLNNANHPTPLPEIEHAVNDALNNWKLPEWQLVGSNQPFEGAGKKKFSGEVYDRQVAFRDEVYRLVEAEKAQKGRPLGPTEIQNIIDRALNKNVDLLRTGFFGGILNKTVGTQKLPYGMALPGEATFPGSKMTGQMETISDKDREALVGIINKMKGSELDWRTMPMDDAKLQRMFMAFKSGSQERLHRIAME